MFHREIFIYLLVQYIPFGALFNDAVKVQKSDAQIFFSTTESPK